MWLRSACGRAPANSRTIPIWGFTWPKEIRPGAFGALDYAVRTSETMGVGLQRLCRYHRVLHDVAEVKLTVDRGRAMLSHHLPVPGGPPRAVSEFIVAGWLALADEVIE
jgi:Arabinose-binding domain of AraC transcription regulator, N-term